MGSIAVLFPVPGGRADRPPKIRSPRGRWAPSPSCSPFPATGPTALQRFDSLEGDGLHRRPIPHSRRSSRPPSKDPIRGGRWAPSPSCFPFPAVGPFDAAQDRPTALHCFQHPCHPSHPWLSFTTRWFDTSTGLSAGKAHHRPEVASHIPDRLLARRLCVKTLQTASPDLRLQAGHEYAPGLFRFRRLRHVLHIGQKPKVLHPHCIRL